jgi:3-dehydroquinate synthase
VVVALGGGVTGDLAGFAAATWLRGVRVVHAPTTLLAMVDSAIGGKTGLDLDGKNLVGAFHAPSGVVADLAWLTTLPARERRCGLAEAWKTAALAGEAQVERLEALARRPDDPDALLAVVLDCARHKAAVVARDEREAGERASLNLGHTLGHALEAWAGGQLLHGEAVAIGVAFAVRLARATGRLAPEVEDRLGALGRALGLELGLPAGATLEALRPWLARDKKARGGAVRWVLPTGLGRWTLAEVDEATVARSL